MFNSHRYQPLLYLKLKALITVPVQRTSPFVPFSLKFYTSTTSQSHSFAVSYLINNLGFSPQAALKASKRLRFNTPQKADSVLAFFKSHGFSDSQISSIVRKQPQILTCDTQRVLPKFEFLASKGASSSDIVLVVTRNPIFVNSSLEKNIIPTYELMKSFFQSDEKTLYCIVTCPFVFMGDRLAQNVKLLVDEGVSYATIGYLFRTRASVLLSHDLRKAVDEVKELGFDPSKILFGIALMAKTAVPKSGWDAKVDAFKSWGWSEEAISEAFRRQPLYMLTSKDKINEVMRLWVNQLGWNSLALIKRPEIFGFSLERRIIPRAFVLHYLLAKGLRDKNDSLCTPFCISEKLFLKKFVECFTEERSQLLKIYQEKKEYSR